jgi:hypothetical protein
MTTARRLRVFSLLFFFFSFVRIGLTNKLFSARPIFSWNPLYEIDRFREKTGVRILSKNTPP